MIASRPSSSDRSSPYAERRYTSNQRRPKAAAVAEDWEAGVTPGNEKFRVFLDGEPVPTAFKARLARGMFPGRVWLYADNRSKRDDFEVRGMHTVVREGHVEIRRGDAPTGIFGLHGR